MTHTDQKEWLTAIAPGTLAGKRALITGASGGIGMALAQAFYAAGAEVCVSGRNEQALKALCQDLQATAPQDSPGRCHPCVMDLSQTAQIPEFYKHIENTVGPIDILVNNAGLTQDGLFMRMKDADWQKVIDVNLTATFALTREALKPMIKNRWGRIITITSVVAFTGNPGQANYCAAKAGLVGMTKALALELASRHITANTIAPGYIQTPMTQDLPTDKMLSMIPCGRLGLPQDIAPAAVFLASDNAAYITGQTLHINGGMAMI